MPLPFAGARIGERPIRFVPVAFDGITALVTTDRFRRDAPAVRPAEPVVGPSCGRRHPVVTTEVHVRT
jgi:hypothetical protein